MYYTILSNAIAFVSSLFLVLLGQMFFVEVLRFLSTGMLLLTFVVTAFVLVPLTGNIKELLFSGAGLFHHLIVPVLSLISFLFAEDRVPTVWVILPLAVTLVYGIIMLYLNHSGKADGPYPFFKINEIGKKRTALWMVILMIVVGVLSAVITYKKPVRTDMKYVFVHGLSGWGSYDTINDFFPYWGLSGGSVIRYLNNQGYESYAASVARTGSEWDRACELYAQLSGTRVDYGLSHSRAAGHERFGEDFTGRALYKNFETSRFSLIGHSFGGATVRLFSEILR
ncbi:MAG: hypothetical protein J6033_07990, partial [Lachnospiraceae bacterium]|nr:hypothetical protein [Lachnospiraceae bacterium]